MQKKIDAELWKKGKNMTSTMLEELREKMEEMRVETHHQVVRAQKEQLALTSPRLRKVILNVFEELVQYLIGVFRIFYHPDGRKYRSICGDFQRVCLKSDKPQGQRMGCGLSQRLSSNLFDSTILLPEWPNIAKEYFRRWRS